MTPTLTPSQATADALAVLKAAGFSEPGFAATRAVRVTSQDAAYPGIQRADNTPKAIATTVQKAGPLTDLREAGRLLATLPGVLQVSADPDIVIVIRNKER